MISGVMEPETATGSAVAEQEQTMAAEQPEKPAETKPETVSTEQANKAIGKVTLYDECVTRIVYVQSDIDEAEEEISELKTQIKNLREAQKANYSKLKALNEDLRDIKNGQYQRKLFAGVEQAEEKPKPVDPGTVTPIDNLGMSEKETELLIGVDIKTIADLELRMRTDPWWHKKIKGFGQAKVDKLSDRLIEWRKLNPVPGEDDEDEDDVIAADGDGSDVSAEASEAEESDEADDGLDAFDQEDEDEEGDEE